jgi:hypothetical protein
MAIAAADADRIKGATAHAWFDYMPALQDLRVTRLSNLAMRDLAELCQREHIELVLLLTPEGPTFQSWYSAESRRRLDDYCAGFCREFRIPLVDARDWMKEEDFLDSHHLLVPGAEQFTRRFGRDVLELLVAGRLHPVTEATTKPQQVKGAESGSGVEVAAAATADSDRVLERRRVAK